jgi:ornithine carbamoyltransferase
VLSRYVAAIVMRTFGDERLTELASVAGVPVVNALTDGFHPCQLLADLLTIRERLGGTKGARSRTSATPPTTWPTRTSSPARWPACTCGSPVRPASIRRRLSWPRGRDRGVDRRLGRGGPRPYEAVDAAEVIATDAWTSMGQESDGRDRLTPFRPYQVNKDLVAAAATDVIVLHCLPAHRGEEITDDVLDGSRSAVFDQAENRLHAQKALLAWLVES